MDDDRRAVFGVEMTIRLAPRRARPDDDDEAAAAAAAADEEAVPADDRIIPEILSEQRGHWCRPPRPRSIEVSPLRNRIRDLLILRISGVFPQDYSSPPQYHIHFRYLTTVKLCFNQVNYDATRLGAIYNSTSFGAINDWMSCDAVYD